MTGRLSDYHRGNGNAVWEGFFFKLVYIGEDGKWFEHGNPKWAIYRHNRLLGYCETSRKPDDYYLELIGEKVKR